MEDKLTNMQEICVNFCIIYKLTNYRTLKSIPFKLQFKGWHREEEGGGGKKKRRKYNPFLNMKPIFFCGFITKIMIKSSYAHQSAYHSNLWVE